MGAVTAVSRALGFVRVLVVAAVLGTTFLGNAFQSANSLSNVLFELLAAGALSAVLVPTFVTLLDAGDERGAEEVAGGVLGVALVVLGGVTVVGIVAAPLVAELFTIGVPASVAEDQQELITFLVRWFVPQVLLYAAGTVATAVLYAKRRFAITAAAPIGNTVVMVAALLAFRVAAGPDPGFDLTTGERSLLVVAGTGGVVAFVATLLVACAASGFRLRPRRPRRDQRVIAMLRHSGWGVVLHTAAGLLLGAAIIGGSAVEGGVVAYQVGFVFFLAPYGVLAQPIHTAILPDLVIEARDGGGDVFAASTRWALERMAMLVVPVSAGMMALALPGMRAVSAGATEGGGVLLLAAAVASLAVGLFPYSAFLLLARGYYAIGDSRTPGVMALVSAALGVAAMAVGAALTDGAARVAALGLGHSLAYTVGAVVLGVRLARRLGGSLVPARFGRVVAIAGVVGTAGWVAQRTLLPADASRLADIAFVAAIGLVGAGVVAAGYRLLGVRGALTARLPVPGGVAQVPEPLP
ncbi:MAG: murein biosynthesis integral membrane protein MurJ [Acidimicrobiales bacterium]